MVCKIFYFNGYWIFAIKYFQGYGINVADLGNLGIMEK